MTLTQALFLLSSTVSLSAGVINADATYTDTSLGSGTYQYNLTLNNTGSTDIGTFWFSWIPGAGFLSALPTNIVAPAGWSSQVTDGDAILFTTNTPLAAAGTASGFQFDSTETPAELMGNFAGPGLGAGDPVTTSFVYIGAPLGDAGQQFVATEAAGPGTVPEPASWTLLAGGAVLLGWGRRRLGWGSNKN